MDKNFAKGLVKRVVLTGGPCGGKTSVQAMLSDTFQNMGWKGNLSFDIPFMSLNYYVRLDF